MKAIIGMLKNSKGKQLMSARQPWKLVLLGIASIAMVVAVVFFSAKPTKQDSTSQWAMPEPVNTGDGGSVKDPFPTPKKVLTPEEIRNGHWGSEQTPAIEADKDEQKQPQPFP